jgi:hypothetical protein
MEKDIILHDGITFVRYPESRSKSARRYYYPERGGKRIRGVGAYHCVLWQAANGPIPDGHHVHHRDGNPLNNSLDNLECLSPAEHCARHAPEFREQRQAHINRIRPAASAWHASPEGRAWHVEHGRETWRNRQGVERTCVQCGARYVSMALRDTDLCCSRACIAKYYRATRRYHEDRACVVCGNTFSIYKYEPQSTCSRRCGCVLRRRSKAGL